MDEPPLDPARIVHVLANHGVEYLLVGGVAAQAHDAKRKTLDVDCLTRHQPENLARLCAALTELSARLRIEGLSDDDAKALSRGVIHPEFFARAEITTFMTDAGPLDILHDIPAPAEPDAPTSSASNAAPTTGSPVCESASPASTTSSPRRSGPWANRPKNLAAVPEMRSLAARPAESSPEPGQRRPARTDPEPPGLDLGL